MRKDPREEREVEGRELARQMETHDRADDDALVVEKDSGNRARENRLVGREHCVVEVGKRRVVRKQLEGHVREADTAGRRSTREGVPAERLEPWSPKTKKANR